MTIVLIPEHIDTILTDWYASRMAQQQDVELVRAEHDELMAYINGLVARAHGQDMTTAYMVGYEEGKDAMRQQQPEPQP